MRSLRRNKLRLALVLVFAMLSGLAGGPAMAFACGDTASPALVSAAAAGPATEGAAAGHCDMPASRPCCCKPSATTKKAGALAAGAELGTSGCGCSLERQDAPPPAEARITRLMPVVDLLFTPAAQPIVARPQTALWVFAAPANGPPRAACNASTPSRAPPAC